MKTRKTYALCLTLGIVVIALCYGGLPADLVRENDLSINVVSKSLINKGAGIQLSYWTKDDIVVDTKARAHIRLQLPSKHSVRVDFTADESIELLVESKSQVFESTEEGVVELELLFIPSEAGKYYIQLLTVLSVQGVTIPQALTIPVYVRDDEGFLPSQASPVPVQIELPAGRF